MPEYQNMHDYVEAKRAEKEAIADPVIGEMRASEFGAVVATAVELAVTSVLGARDKAKAEAEKLGPGARAAIEATKKYGAVI